MRWCPGPGCTFAVLCEFTSGMFRFSLLHLPIILMESTLENRVSCKCGYQFCFVCHQEAHSPATCEQVGIVLRCVLFFGT